jgi:hypothetical protein
MIADSLNFKIANEKNAMISEENENLKAIQSSLETHLSL